ncbi:MAG: hypothetical protein EAZ20_11500 [Bacteroidetes bacterium]|nr:MAG: hypothetical protein EAZ20_11500 [Bacteroidota bacterium]
MIKKRLNYFFMTKTYYTSIVCILFFFNSTMIYAQTAGEYIEAGQLYFKNKAYYDALKNFNRAFITDSSNVESLIWRGQTNAKLGLYEESLKDFELGSLIKPNESRFYNEKGMILMYQGKYEQALNSFLVANGIDSKAFHFLMIAEIQWILKSSTNNKKYNHHQIIKNFSSASQKQPKWFLPYRRMGEILQDSLKNTMTDEFQLASQICNYYKKASDLDDEKAKKLLKDFCGNNYVIDEIIKKGNYFVLTQNFEKAVEMYDKVLENGDSKQQYYYQTLFQKAKTLAKKNKHQDAILNYSAVLKIIPIQNKKEIANAFYHRALSFISIERYENALIDFNQAFAFGLDNGFMYAERANLKLKLNQKEDACKDWKEAEKNGWKEAEKNIKLHCQK